MTAIRKLYTSFIKIEGIVFKILANLAVILLALSVSSVLFQVLYRNVLIHILPLRAAFTEEFSRISIIWAVYLFLPICIKEGRHATVTLLIDRVKNKARYGLYFLIQGIALSFFIVTFRYSLINIALNSTYVSPAMRLPGIFIFSSVTLGLFFATLQIALEIFGVICGILKPFSSLPDYSSDETLIKRGV